MDRKKFWQLVIRAYVKSQLGENESVRRAGWNDYRHWYATYRKSVNKNGGLDNE